MLTTENKKEIEIAIRLYDNKAYGTTQGKGIYRTALYNGTMDTKQPTVKYLVDLYNYDDWENKAKTDMQMVILEAVDDVKDKLYSWIYRYDSSTKQKTLVQGVCTLDLQSLIMDILIFDPVASVEERWQVQAKPCRQSSTGQKSPQLLATNGELTNW
jgi:hypothetical protein